MPTFSQRVTDVIDATGAAEAGRLLAPARELAVDLEADAMHAFRARLCFLQVGTDEDILLLDTLQPGVGVDALAPLLADPARTKYFHAAQGDLQYLAEAGARVAGLFDTHRAATLLGRPKVGLADLVRELLGVELAKEHQQSDFALRPLPPGMRDYIADDVRYLCEVGRQMRALCEGAGVLEEVLLDCERMCAEAASRPEASDFKPKFPRTNLPPDRLALAEAIARALHVLRLQWAEAADVPFGRMLSNMAVTELALKPPADLKALSRVPGVRGAFVREHGEEVLALVRRLQEDAQAGRLVAVREDKAPRDPNRRKREEALKAWRTAKAQERKVTPSVVLPNPLLDALASRPPESPEALAALPWFGEKGARLYTDDLLKLLAPLR